MTYDDWKTQYPPDWDYEEEKECFECGKPMMDSEKGSYCSSKCRDVSMI